MEKLPLGAILIENNLITPVQLERGLQIQRETGGRIGEILLAQSFLQERDLIYALGLQMDIPFSGGDGRGTLISGPGQLISFGTSLIAENDFDRLLVLIGAQVAELLDCDRAYVLLMSQDGSRLWGRIPAGRSHLHAAAIDVEEVSMDVQVGIAGRVVQTGLSYSTDDAYHDPNFYPGIDNRIGYRTHTLATVAMRSQNGRIIGALEAVNQHGGGFSDMDLKSMEALAHQAAVALETSRTHRDLVLTRERLMRENLALKRELKREYRFKSVVGKSRQMERVVSSLERACDADVPVLLVGETGTGRTHLCKTIHYNSKRGEQPLIIVDCASMPEPALEQDIFGAEATDAQPARSGAIERADGGTLVLRDVNTLPASLQARLLRLLVEGTVARVGADARNRVDVRVLAVSPVDLKDEAAKGRFRDDLYYRLNILPVTLPPLRERREDIALLARHFLDIHAARMHRKVEGFTPEAIELLEKAYWPGNVAELESEIERVAAIHSGATMVGVEAFRPELTDQSAHALGPIPTGGTLKETVQEIEIRIIREALKKHRGNRTRVARDLGLSRVGLLQKLRRYGLDTL